MATSLVLVRLKNSSQSLSLHFSSQNPVMSKQPNNHKHGDALCSSSNNFKRLVISLSIDLLIQTIAPPKAVSEVGVRKNQKIDDILQLQDPLYISSSYM